jgi:hypothetical protein
MQADRPRVAGREVLAGFGVAEGDSKLCSVLMGSSASDADSLA